MMNEERNALRAENTELRKALEEAMAKCAELSFDNDHLRGQLSTAQRGNDRLNAQMEVVYLIFGGGRRHDPS